MEKESTTKMSKLLHDYVYIEHVTEEKTKSGLYIPTNEVDKQLKGRVLMVGKDIDDENIKVGTVVYFDKLNASPFLDNYLIEYSDIIAVIPE